MWRRESGGTGSGPIGDVAAVVGAQNPGVTGTSHGQWLPSNSHQTQQAPRRCDSTELADEPVRAFAIKLVRDLNRAVATHVALAALLGGSGDCPHLRDELRRARRTAQEAAAAAKATLLPALLDPGWVEKERTELERLWHLLLCCLDSLETSMQRSLILLREFSIADGSNILIHTGLDGAHQHHHQTRAYQTTACEAGDVPLFDKLALEGAEASQLCKELFELRAQLLELKSAVEIRSFLSAPDCFAVDEISPMLKKPRRNDTQLSINGTEGQTARSSVSCSITTDDKESIESDLESQATGITSSQRKCVCMILAIMVTIFVLVMVLGILVGLLS